MKIDFIPASKEAEMYVPRPLPAKNYIPDWYKDIKLSKDVRFGSGGAMFVDGMVKKCVPFLEGFSHGYIQETWTDIYVKKSEYGIEYIYSHEPTIMTVRDKKSINVSGAFYQIECAWQLQWYPKMPKGWSMIFTSPFNRLDLPFRSLTGVIDSDNFYDSKQGNYPFFIEKDFEGLIPAGTPMFQMIPIKRENWKSDTVKFDLESHLKNTYKLTKYLTGGYKKLFWERKSFE